MALPCLDRTVEHQDSAAFSVGHIQYNGVKFNMITKCQGSVTPVYSDSGATLQYLRHILRVDTLLSAWSCTDASPALDFEANAEESVHKDTTGGTLAAYRSKLLRPGKELYAKCCGFGYDLHIPEATSQMPVNIGDATPGIMIGGEGDYFDENGAKRVELLFGPKPQELNWEQLGSYKMARVNWAVEFHLSRCPYPSSDITSIEWDITWSLTEAGMTTRTTNGYWNVANRMISTDRNVMPIVANDADRFRNNLNTWIPPLPGYHRRQEYRLSADRSRMLFTLVDTEIDSGQNAYFPGIIRADVTRSVHSGGKIPPNAKTTTKWGMTLSGTIEVAPKLPIKLAWTAFITIVREQLSYFEGVAGIDPGVDADDGAPPQQKKAKFVILSNLRIDEELFGRSVSFSIGWHFTTTLQLLIQSTGMFNPLDARPKKGGGPDKIHDWTLWHSSLEYARDPRGVANMQFSRLNDIRVDMCSHSQAPFQHIDTADRNIIFAGDPILQPDEPDAEFSYLAYHNSIDAIESTGTVAQRTVRKPSYEPKEFAGDHTAFRQDEGVIEFARSGYDDSQNNKSLVTHRRGDSVYAIRLRGYCLRAGRASPEPVLKSWRGIPVKLTRRKVTINPIGKTSTVIYASQWYKEYVIEGALTGNIARSGSLDLNNPQVIGQGAAEGII